MVDREHVWLYNGDVYMYIMGDFAHMFDYKTSGTCSRMIHIDAEGGIIRRVVFDGGCTGNLQGVSRLVEGMPVEEAIRRLKGIQCRGGTSCPDQLAKALLQMQARQK